ELAACHVASAAFVGTSAGSCSSGWMTKSLAVSIGIRTPAHFWRASGPSFWGASGVWLYGGPNVAVPLGPGSTAADVAGQPDGCAVAHALSVTPRSSGEESVSDSPTVRSVTMTSAITNSLTMSYGLVAPRQGRRSKALAVLRDRGARVVVVMTSPRCRPWC